ncbi:MAG: energy-coupled thiamine transporter ThiT [Lachnospiraceae bacterium]|nr:energy-coupled thiamine transporter ThiT [Lachnospiraceae bacterium]
MSLFFISGEDGSYSITKAGIAALIVLIVLLLLIVSLFRSGKKEKKKGPAIDARTLAFTSLSIALAFVLSYVRIFRMPWSGSVTLCSMLFIVLIGYWYGLKVGLIAGFVYGCLQFIQGGGSYILDPLQAGLDYFFAFTALGLSGLFCRMKKYGLTVGYIVAVIARASLHSLGGYLYWMDYMPEDFPEKLAPFYPIVYNFSYIMAEAAITLIVINFPLVKDALSRITEMARKR